MTFSYLVKAFCTSNYALIVSIMVKYGASPILSSEIKRMYDKIVFKLIINKIETSIDFKVSFKQVDRMAPVIFLFLMMAFAKTLEEEWTSLGLSKAQLAQKDNSPRSTVQLVSHQPGTFTCGALFDLFCMLYVDVGTFFFEYRTSVKIGIILLSNYFARFGLEMHINTGINPSKTECVFFPPPGFFNTCTFPLTDPTNSTLFLQKK